MVLCETIVDFKNLKENGFDFTETLDIQGWKTFFERLTYPVYPVLVKQFWVHTTVEKETITSYVMNRKIVITEKSIADTISHDGKGKRIHNAKITSKREAIISPIIFKEETNFFDEKSHSAKDLTRNLRVWFKIILGCIHHRPSTNSSNYSNTRQKFMLFYLEKGVKLGLPLILFKFMRDSIRESRTAGSSKKTKIKSIPNGRLISDILMGSGLTKELVKDAGKVFWGKNLKSMGIISRIQRPDFIMSKDDIYGTRNPIDDYPIFTKTDPPRVLMAYLESCLKDGLEPLVDPFNLLETCHDVHGKRKKEFRDEGSSSAQKNKKIFFQDEDEVPLSARQKAMILKDTSGIVQSSSRASDITSGKLPSDNTHFNSDSISSERILLIPPPSQSAVSKPIPLPPSESTFINPIVENPIIETPIIEMHITETPLVSAPLLEKQHISPTSSPPQL
ncbi:uncharacterized protein LOC127131441 [Lathyrus oleraceus]|uniref:uncharacterized protein LOC127131441 n=1 Tax=Pisum sativum TaxID=3888 RepID=UPI0021D21929|nr:uncharacterized protein LOC127131441 [Pisum sativum]